MKLKDARHLSPKAQEALRYRGVRAVVDKGRSQVEAVEGFGGSRTAVYHWVKADRQQGARALKAKKQGRRTSSRLAGEQAATVVRLIQTLADEMGIRTDAQAGTSSSKQGQTPVVKDTVVSIYLAPLSWETGHVG
jgi:transposase